MNEKIEAKLSTLKQARLELLRLHKLLIDSERETYEKINGQVSSGQFLNLLVGDKSFEWLRKFSSLIAEIDEMLDLDDGFTKDMVDKYLKQISSLLNPETTEDDFKEKFRTNLTSNQKASAKCEELKKILAEC